jgi:RHS repeat-associated protein
MSGRVRRRAVSALVVFCVVAGGVQPVASASPPAEEPAEGPAWLAELEAGDRPDDFASPATKPAESAPPIESEPLDTGTRAATLPRAGAAEVTLAARGVAKRAGGSPVRVSAGTSAAVGSSVRVEVLDQEAAERAGVRGLLLRVSDAEQAEDAGDAERAAAGRKRPVTVSVDYSAFADLYGGGYADRLRVVALPACAVADPLPASCDPTGDPLPSRIDRANRRVVADVEDLATVQALAVMAGPDGEGGSYEATPFALSGDWQVGIGSGEFSWNYNFPVLAAPAGATPDVSLSYSSGAVDGMVSSKNTQPGNVGLGWGDFANAFIERRYNPCADEGTAQGDLCWPGHNATISLNGKASELVPTPGTNAGTWVLKDDPRWSVQRRTVANDPGIDNGDDDGEHWKVTTPDGTQYWFGIGRDPEVTEHGLTTASTWTVPVVGDDPAAGGQPAEPCHAATDHICDQAWRWNLDRVVDPNGNERWYEYVAETNTYGPANREYVRAGYLKRIWYGSYLDEDDYAASVIFDTGFRCETLDDPDPGNELGGQPCPHPSQAPPGLEYPDVPLDLQCGGSGSVCPHPSPTFFSKERYTGLRVCARSRFSSGCEDIDVFKLTHRFSSTEEGTDDDKLFLTGIQRTGHDPGPGAGTGDDTTLTMPPTTFTPVALANRLFPGVGESQMRHWRIGKVTDEFGREVSVTYGRPHPCNAVPAHWDLNTDNCFPQLWGPEGATPTFRAFNKWLVTQVEVKARAGDDPSTTVDESPPMVTRYLYGSQINDPAIAGSAPQSWSPTRDQAKGAWHHDQDPFMAQANISWSEWRGYQDVLVVAGQARTRYKLYRGMDDDLFREPFPGGFREVTVSSLDGTVTNSQDSNRLAGRILDEASLRPDGTEETGKVHGYQSILLVDATGNDPMRDAWWVGENDTVTRRRTPAGGTVYRRSRVETVYHALLRFPERAIEHGWMDASGDERCTRTEYAFNATLLLLDYPQRVTTYGAADCTGTIVSRSETAYDGAAVGVPPTRGNPTASRVQTSTLPSPNGTWSTTTTAHDRFGRAISVTDPNGHTTSTLHGVDNDDMGFPDRVVVTNAEEHEIETSFTYGRFLPAWSEDPNDNRTTYAYDALGRVTQAWQPTEDTEGPASWEFAYDVDAERDDVPVTQSRQLQDLSGPAPNTARYLDSWMVYDSLLRERQTHTRSPDGAETIVSDTTYDTQGRTSFTNIPEAVTGTPGSGVLGVPANGWRNTTQTLYDHLDRPAWQLLWADEPGPDDLDLDADDMQRSTVTTYTHETTEVDPLLGGNTRTKVDGLGRTIEVAEHDGSAYRTTTSTYDKNDQLLTVTDPAGNRITYGYDLAGRRVTMHDPDAGDWSYAYDAGGNATSVTDAQSVVVHTNYDGIGRPTERRKDNSTTGQVLASWSYDASGELGLLNASTRVTPTGNWVVDITGYDARDRPTGRSWDIPAGLTGLPDPYAVTYGYDRADHVTSVEYPAVGGLPQETVSTTYDSLGLPDTMNGLGEYVWLSGYDDRARPALFGYGPASDYALAEYLEYDLNQELRVQQATANGGNVVQNRTLEYDLAGRLIERDTTLAGAAFRECFGYDPRSRLTSAYTTAPANECATGAGKGTGATPYSHTYAYTHDGNLQTRVEGSTTVPYTYPASGPTSTRPHAPTQVGANSYTWNTNGNQATRTIGGQTQTLTWDAEHRLASLDGPAGNNTFTYDAEGNRLLRQTPTGTTLYLEGHEIRVPAGGGATTAVRSYGFRGRTIATRTSTGVDYLVVDNQGSVEQTVPSGSTTAEHTRTYLPYGKVRSGGQPDTDRTWIGQVEDDTTGLQYLNARYYDPATGVFTAPDPLADPAAPKSFNPYQYGLNNPVDNSDPSGALIVPDGGFEWKGSWGTGSIVVTTTYQDENPQDPSNEDLAREFFEQGGGDNGRLAAGNPWTNCSPSSANPTCKTHYTVLSPDDLAKGFLWNQRREQNQAKNRGDFIGLLLLGAGFVPGLGETLDLKDAISSALKGDWSGAALSTAGLLPVVNGRGLRLTDEMVEGAQAGNRGAREANERIIGNYPDYIQADGNKFDIPSDAWNRMSETEQWEANQRFLDRGLRNGDTFVLTTPIETAREGSVYLDELAYLMSQADEYGYRLSDDGTRFYKA